MVTGAILFVSAFAVIRAMRWLYPRRFVQSSSQRLAVDEALRRSKRREARERYDAQLDREEQEARNALADRLRGKWTTTVSFPSACPWCSAGLAEDGAHVCEWPRGAA